MLFKDIIGQSAIKKRLIHSVQDNRISHAQLFLGPEGSGNLALAIAYAQYISCENRTPEDSCGTCPSCLKYAKLIHPDLHFVYPVATTKSITKEPVSDDFIKEWREILLQNPYIRPTQWYEYIGVENKQGLINKFESSEIVRKLSLKTFEAEYKVMIIWMPEKMNIVAANKLLKILEEPPAKTVFILAAESSSLMLQTILSRCQLVKINKLKTEELLTGLVEKYQLEEKEATSITRVANGNVLVALESMQTQSEDSTNFNHFVQIMRLSYARSIPEIVDWVDTIAALGREKQKSFLNYALRLTRENFMLNQKQDELTFLKDDELGFSQKFSAFINRENVFQISAEFEKACRDIERNAYGKIVFLDLALKLVKLIRN